MKQRIKSEKYIFFILLITLILPSAALANIDNLTNMSAEWMRTSNRNAATDATDIVVYNPAGLVKLSDGFHINLSNQTMDRGPKHSFNMGDGKQEYKQDSTDWFIPNFYAAYKKDNWAVFGGVYIPGGGAVADYPNGSISTVLMGSEMIQRGYGEVAGLEAAGMVPAGTSQMPGLFSYDRDSLEASSLYLTTTLGGAYAVNDKLSFAFGLRYISAKNTTEAGLTFTNALEGTKTEYKMDTEDTADGFGAVFGVNYAPADKWNIGMHYESKVKLDFETEQNRDDFGMSKDGEKNRRDFPGMIGLGVAYDVRPDLTLEFDFNWWFQKSADWGSDASGRDYSDMAGDCYSIGTAAIYKANPKLTVSGGILFTKFLFDDMDAYYTNMGAYEVLYSDNWNISGGCGYEVIDGLKLNLGIGLTVWSDESIKALAAQPMDLSVDTENSTWTLSVGFDWNFGGPKKK